jgi:hypothetical protein
MVNAPSGGIPLPGGGNYGGHVGWAFQLSDGTWEFGANEGPNSVNYDTPSRTWHATGTYDQMLAAFAGPWPANGFDHGGGFYTAISCEALPTTTSDLAAAEQTVINENNETYTVPGADCLSDAVNVLTKYGVPALPNDVLDPIPNNYFNSLPGAGFGSAQTLLQTP